MSQEENDKPSNLDDGDIGLGRGWKPGGIPKDESDRDNGFPHGGPPSPLTLGLGSSFASYGIFIPRKNSDPECSHCSQRRKSTKLSKKLKNVGSLSIDTSHTSADSVDDSQINGSINCGPLSVTDIPVYADIPIGTSLRQQRELFSHDLHELFAYVGDLQESPSSPSANSNASCSSTKLKPLDKGLLQRKLVQAQEVCVKLYDMTFIQSTSIN